MRWFLVVVGARRLFPKAYPQLLWMDANRARAGFQFNGGDLQSGGFRVAASLRSSQWGGRIVAALR
ncbi:MAG: hypothetical protein LBR88_09935, partial [Zoogloeaceae bacterium]|nr:hypothetical protein [Zoogloeaceae bacterium]